MKLNKNIKIALIGALIWIVIFAIGVFALHTPEGAKRFDAQLTQAVFFIAQTLFALTALLHLLGSVRQGWTRAGATIGAIWFFVFCALDFAVLMPLFNIPVGVFLTEYMPSYFTLPILGAGMGAAFTKAHQQN